MTDSPRWLDDDQQQVWADLRTVVIALPALLDRQLERDAGISNFEYSVMARLSMTETLTMRLSDWRWSATAPCPAVQGDGPLRAQRLGAAFSGPGQRPLHAGRADRGRPAEGREQCPGACGGGATAGFRAAQPGPAAPARRRAGQVAKVVRESLEDR